MTDVKIHGADKLAEEIKKHTGFMMWIRQTFEKINKYLSKVEDGPVKTLLLDYIVTMFSSADLPGELVASILIYKGFKLMHECMLTEKKIAEIALKQMKEKGVIKRVNLKQ